jgi:hypothetical protein
VFEMGVHILLILEKKLILKLLKESIKGFFYQGSQEDTLQVMEIFLEWQKIAT